MQLDLTKNTVLYVIVINSVLLKILPYIHARADICFPSFMYSVDINGFSVFYLR